MFPTTSSLDAGSRLRAERRRLHLSTRDVERLSGKIADEKKNHEYSLSHAWVTDIENGKFIPGIFKLCSLSLIYKRSYGDILGFFGIHIRDIGKEQSSIVLPHTHLVRTPLEDVAPTIQTPLDLRAKVRFEETNLVSRMFQRWGEVPVGILQQLDLRNSVYGYIGNEDYTLYPLIRPGSFVQIDSHQRKIKRGDWQNEFERPIYFVELRDSYVCSWCELVGSDLILIPSPQSRTRVQHVRFREDAKVVGRVIGVTMQIAEMQPSASR